MYIIDECISSQKNGIGTFLQQLIICLKEKNEICLVLFNADVDEFTMLPSFNGIRKMMFPKFRFGGFDNYNDIIQLFFQLYISDSEDNIFLINHSPCVELLLAIKRVLPLSKIVFVVHDLGWTNPLLGNIEYYKKIICNKEDGYIKATFPFLIARYEIECKMFDLVDKVVCLSLDTFNLLCETYELEKQKIIMLPNGLSDTIIASCDKVSIRNEFLIGMDEEILLFVGRPIASKGIDVLLEAFENVVVKRPNLRLVIVGSCNASRYESILKRYNHIAARIIFTGLLEKNFLNKWYSIAKIGILPSYYEQCSYVGIEMMMHGLPIITTNGYGIRNMFQEDLNARIVPLDYDCNHQCFVNNLIEAILDLLTSESLCEKYSLTARTIYEQKYQIKYMKQRWCQFMNSFE